MGFGCTTNAGSPSLRSTASIAAVRADLTPVAYAASKGAVLSLVIAANDRLTEDGDKSVRVNAIVPGGVLTPVVMGVAQDLESQGLELKGYDMQKYPPIMPEDIANVVLFMLSDESSPIRGASIACDLGMTTSMGSQPPPVKKQAKKKR